QALGPQFSNTICVNRVCVANAGSGSAGTSGSANGGSGASAGSVGAGGSSGTGGQPECSKNADCIGAHLQQPYLCKAQQCVALVTSDCPLVLPSANALDLLNTGSPIVLGAYANMNNAQNPHDSQAVINWDLALTEFDDPITGLAIDGTQRPLVALVCQSAPSDVTPTIQHLVQDIAVPGVLSTLSTDRLFDAFEFTQTTDYASAGGQPVFFLSTGSADLRLANLADDGLIWHMLGDPHVLGATIVGLLKRMEPYVNAQRKATSNVTMDDPDTVPLRVTLVYSDDSTMTDLFTVLTTPDADHPETLLTFNGMSAIEQPTNFREVKIDSIKNHASPDVSSGIMDLETHPPHIVLALATAEFPKFVVPAIENTWSQAGSATAGLERPYYLMSHFIYSTPELLNVASQFSSMSPPLDQRVLGVNYAEAQDPHSKDLYNAYEARLQGTYQGSLPLDGTENHYDGAYSLMYSVAAAANARGAFTGDDIRDGLEQRIFATSPLELVDVGPTPIENGSIGKLSMLAYKMSLQGTMGPPNFDRASGTRISTTSAWCIAPAANSTWVYQADGLIYDPTSQLLTAPSAGVPPCLAAY
ncbi:MAG TPA: hypothetical protein VGM29_03090, partial [Polyangiaceae bacterium]